MLIGVNAFRAAFRAAGSTARYFHEWKPKAWGT